MRHFDAPEALSTRFYEVRAKPILNRVPEASQMPFRWAINPYRGCTHACSYCGSGGTPILMVDGRHKPLEELEVGEKIYGTIRRGKYRRYATTTVLDKWITVKPAFRVITEDSTELIRSGDHRLLTNRGWKHVINGERSLPDRPHLTTANHLIGTGAFAPQPTHNGEYRRGYLCGMIRGDGHLGSYTYQRDSSTWKSHHFRLALADLEALNRSRDFLDRAGIDTHERVFAQAVGGRREMLSSYSGCASNVERTRATIEWPGLPSLDWCRGFLAGIFDAEGGRSTFVLRIANTDPQILAWTEACATRLGFGVTRDRPADRNGLQYIRIVGGLSEHLRFVHLTDPAISRKRSIEGQMVKTFAKLRAVAIEPLGTELPLYDITTGTGDFIANGVVSHNCFARPSHTYLDFNAGRDFEREIVVKVNAPERLRAELARPSWKREHIALGTNTDPYQWVEGRYRLMRGIWGGDDRGGQSRLGVDQIPAVAARSRPDGAPGGAGGLQRRAVGAHPGREGVAGDRAAYPASAGPAGGRRRARPGRDPDRDRAASAARRPPAVLRMLAEHRPDLVGRYRELYRNGAYAPTRERRRLARLVQGPKLSPWQRGARASLAAPEPVAPEPSHRQERLFEAG